MISIAVNGALGRMGARILHLAYQSQDFKIGAAFECAESEWLGKELAGALGLPPTALKVKITVITPQALKNCQVLIDFSNPEGAEKCLEAAVKANRSLVVGTTGISRNLEEKIKANSKKIPILFSPNMSIGANFLFEMARLAASKLKEGYDIEIIEQHHRQKKDAPSGTAKNIAKVIAEAKGWDISKVAKYGRAGLTGERPRNEIGIHVVRAGDIVGEHTVLFSGPGETIEITHKAQSRDAFARGALVAALFLAGKKKGLYQMADVLR